MRGLLSGYVLAACLLAMPVLAQTAAPPVENVTVNGRRVPDEEIHAFVTARTAPTFKLGKVARWEKGICPTAMGLKSDFTDFVKKRVKEIAARVGAPLDPNANCQPDIQIVFTTAPQDLLNNIRKNSDALLGYHDNDSQAEEMAKVTHPIQAWYSTVTIDVRGVPRFDGGKITGIGCVDLPKCRIYLPRAQAYAVTGDRVGDGLRSGFHDVIIVIDPKKLGGYEIGALADYIAFLAMTQPRSLDDCQQLPSILNLLASGCKDADTTSEMTESDLGYLKGVYHMKDDDALAFQQDQITYQVKQALLGR
ncbi:MAG TPA: hypothetical protein VHZ32_15880 [Rhizomicrobium sp.]|jgi:hypothetical protein|nr:hypothetical protein [Rhizomicrobium sp.]